MGGADVQEGRPLLQLACVPGGPQVEALVLSQAMLRAVPTWFFCLCCAGAHRWSPCLRIWADPSLLCGWLMPVASIHSQWGSRPRPSREQLQRRQGAGGPPACGCCVWAPGPSRAGLPAARGPRPGDGRCQGRAFLQGRSPRTLRPGWREPLVRRCLSWGTCDAGAGPQALGPSSALSLVSAWRPRLGRSPRREPGRGGPVPLSRPPHPSPGLRPV